MLLFDAIESLTRQIDVKNIHDIRVELVKIVAAGRKNHRLRMITRFLTVLEAVVGVYEFDDAESISVIKSLVKQSLDLILDMTKGSSQEGIMKIDNALINAFALLKHKSTGRPFVSEPSLIEQLALDISNDIASVKQMFHTASVYPQKDFEVSCYYLKRLYKFVHLMGFADIASVVYEILIELEHRYQQNNWSRIGSDSGIMTAFDFLMQFTVFLQEHVHEPNQITDYLKSQSVSEIIETVHSKDFITSDSGFGGNLLSEEEIDALMQEEVDYVVSFDENLRTHPVNNSKIIEHQEKSLAKQIVSSKNEYIHLNQEDKIIELAGKLFLKHEQIKNTVGKHLAVTEEFKEIDEISSHLKQILFDQYYITVGELLGQELRMFIRNEVRRLSKKIRLGIKGEHTEILHRLGDSVKHLIFNLVKFSLNNSLESASRRKAFDKGESGSLFLEFDDVSDYLTFSVRDDGHGIGEKGLVFFESMKKEVEAQDGIIEIDSEENEYLKVRIRLPMKKIITRSLVIGLGETKVLLPARCIEQVITTADISLMDGIRQIALFIPLGLDRSPINMYILCRFGNEKILFGVDKAFYELDALGEDADVPLIACSSSVVVVKDGSIGFLLDERKLYMDSKRLIQKRMDAFSIL